MTTTEKIQAVLATGKLGLPEGLTYSDGFGCFFYQRPGDAKRDFPNQQAYDMIACEWARKLRLHDSGRRSLHWDERYDEEIAPFIARGDTEAAINAIYEALCGGGPK